MAAGSIEFSNELFHFINAQQGGQNLIFSPVSIKTSLALAYLGAEGETAEELRIGLKLKGADKEEIAGEFDKFITKINKTTDAKLKMANRMYVDKRFQLLAKFNELAGKYLHAAAETVQFANANETANKINAWTEQNTENKIQNLIAAESLDAQTAAVLVNAIYFKADWLSQFEDDCTEKKDFHVSASTKQLVDMMYQKDNFLYGDLEELQAIALEMPYAESNLSMLVLLPKQMHGLPDLELKLRATNLNELTAKLEEHKVRVHLPRFNIEFDISLQSTLEQMGMRQLFTPAANFQSLLATSLPLSISEVKHKAFIEVNEKGTTAAGATFAKISATCFVFNEQIFDFNADHPFFFAIKDNATVYFVGHVTNFP